MHPKLISQAEMTLDTLHMCFNANPMWTSKTLKIHEDEKAAKKAAKEAAKNK